MRLPASVIAILLVLAAMQGAAHASAAAVKTTPRAANGACIYTDSRELPPGVTISSTITQLRGPGCRWRVTESKAGSPATGAAQTGARTRAFHRTVQKDFAGIVLNGFSNRIDWRWNGNCVAPNSRRPYNFVVFRPTGWKLLTPIRVTRYPTRCKQTTMMTRARFNGGPPGCSGDVVYENYLQGLPDGRFRTGVKYGGSRLSDTCRKLVKFSRTAGSRRVR